MGVDTELATLHLQINPQIAVLADDLDHLTRQLRREISSMDVESVDLEKHGPVPAGAKSVEAAVTLGSLAVVVLPTLLPKIVEFLQSWLTRGDNRGMKLKLQVGGNSVEVEYSANAASPVEIQKLVGRLTHSLRPATS